MKKVQYLSELRGVDLEHAEFRILTLLLSYADRECRNAFPGNARLARDMGIKDVRRVIRVLRALEEKGYIAESVSHSRTRSWALTLPANPGHGDQGKGGHGDHGGDGHGDHPTTTEDQVLTLRSPVVASRVRADAPAHARGADQAEPKAKRGTRLPADFIPSEKSRKTILTESPTLDLRREHAKFVDHWAAAPGQRGVKLDWDATWRNWMRKAAEQKQPRANGAPARRQQETDDLFARAMARAEAADETTLPITIRGELA